jgi:ribosome-associated protein
MVFSETIIDALKKEFTYVAVRSSGPGGQNVNKVSSKIEIRFRIEISQAFSDEQKQILISKLNKKLTSDGDLVVTCQEDRSQLKNKKTATDKLLRVLQLALTTRKRRKPTRPTKSSIEKRLELKKQRSVIKHNRRETDL